MTGALDEFDDAAHAFLTADAVRNTILLTVPATVRRRGADAFGTTPPRFGWCTSPNGEVTAAFVHTPPHPVVLTAMSAEDAASLAQVLDEARYAVPGVSGSAATVAAFAELWREKTGAASAVRMHQRLYRLGGLTHVSPEPAGHARIAADTDHELLVAWYNDFAADAGGLPGDPDRAVRDRIGYGGLTVWEVDGRPVSMAGVTEPVAGTVRVAPVYTPPELRGRGYAGAVTAAISRQALDAGADEVVLFTDLDNPTSNALYQRIGYVEVEDYLVLSLA